MCDSQSSPGVSGTGPSILDLIRLSARDVLPPGGEAVYREVALLADLHPDRPKEVIDVAAGNGGQLIFLAEEFGVHASGVDPDPRIVERAAARARAEGFSDRLQFQEAPLSALPYRDEIFDVAIGELGLTADPDPERAIQELVRVTRPGGSIVLLQLVWKAPVSEARKALVASHLGVQPRMLVEWKQKLAEVGVTDLHVTDWSDDQATFRPRLAKPFPDFAEMFTLREKLSILRRARRIWGWSGVRTALECESEVHRLLTRERILGLVMIKGVRSEVAAVAGAEAINADSGAIDAPAGAELPLFRTPGAADPEVEPEPALQAMTPSEAPTRQPAQQPVHPPARPSPRPRVRVPATDVQDLPLFSDDGKADK